MVCGLYQLFGVGFLTDTGRYINGIGVFRATTCGSATRLVGNITVQSPFGTLVGFENHSGQTTLLPDQQPLGQVLKGWGNNQDSQLEGAITNNTVGTYLHGPVLPKNPALTDHLILCALRRRNLAQELAPLNDDLETTAAAAASRRPQKMSNDMTIPRSPRRSLFRSPSVDSDDGRALQVTAGRRSDGATRCADLHRAGAKAGETRSGRLIGPDAWSAKHRRGSTPAPR